MEIPALYKMVLNTDAEDRAELVRYCLEKSLLGMGWGARYLAGDVPRDFDEYYARAENVWSSRALGPVRAFHEAAARSLVWFRDLQGQYYLARLTGRWHLLHGPTADRLDLGNVRKVEYEAVDSPADVPGAVIRAYAAPRQWTFCHVNGDGVRAYSALLASELLGGDPPDLEISTSKVLKSLLGPLDVEDLVAAFLQDRRNYIALPARYAGSTAVYEYELKHRGDGHVAVVQVKTGGATVPIDALSQSVADKWFVYTDKDQELPQFVERITKQDLMDYMESGAHSLPPVTERWMRRVGHTAASGASDPP